MADDRPNPGEGRDETDERFPSGEWVGFWLQHGFTGRQWMRGVHLRFSGGRVAGHGSDCVGDFDFAGRYELETGKCEMVKQYVDAGLNHLVFHAPGHDQKRFLDLFKSDLEPRLRALK